MPSTVRRPPKRNGQRIQIYLKPGSSQDKILLDVWDGTITLGMHSQAVFRDILHAGIRKKLEDGSFNGDLVEHCRLLDRYPLVRVHKAAEPSQEAHPQQVQPRPAQNPVPKTPVKYPQPAVQEDLDTVPDFLQPDTQNAPPAPQMLDNPYVSPSQSSDGEKSGKPAAADMLALMGGKKKG